MLFFGVDPGKHGGIAAIDDTGKVVTLRPVPLLESATERDQYDLPAIVSIFAAVDPVKWGGVHVELEKLGALPAQIKGKPMGGSLANFNRGVADGWRWMLTALLIQYELVRPQTWQKVMLAGTDGTDTKQRSIQAAQRLFPLADLRPTHRSRKLSDGMSDALLLAEYGRRTMKGGV